MWYILFTTAIAYDGCESRRVGGSIVYLSGGWEVGQGQVGDAFLYTVLSCKYSVYIYMYVRCICIYVRYCVYVICMIYMYVCVYFVPYTIYHCIGCSIV